MNIIDSIQKAREKGISDEQIIAEIRKQNPEKEEFFAAAENKGASASKVLNEIIKQNTEKEAEKPSYAKDAKGEDEEETRKRFLERIEQKEGFTTPSPEIFGPGPLPTKTPQSPPSPEAESVAEQPDSIPKRPTKKSKIWIRIVIAMGVVAVLSVSLAFLYETIFLKEPPTPKEKIIEKEVFVPRAPDPLITLDKERDDIVRLSITSNEEYIIKLRRAIREEEDGEILRLIVEDQKEEPRISNLEDFFLLFEIEPPELFFETIEKDFTLFLYTGREKNRLGFVAGFEKEDKEKVEWTIMRPWESTIEEDFRKLLSFLEVEIPATEEDLNPTVYERRIGEEYNIRYREVPEEDRFVLIREDAPVYYSPEEEFPARTVQQGERYQRLEEENDWYKIIIRERVVDREFWIRKDMVIDLDPPEENIGIYYSIAEDRIVFSASLESIKAIIDRI